MSLDGPHSYDAPNPEIAKHEEQQREQESQYLMDSERKEITNSSILTKEGLVSDVEKNPKVDKMLSRFKKIAEEQGIEGYDVFEKFIQKAPSDIKEKFLGRTYARTLKKNIESGGVFPTNTFEFNQGIVILEGHEKKVVSEDEKEAEEDIDIYKKQRQKLVDVKNSLSGIKLSNKVLVHWLNQIEGLPTTSIIGDENQKLKEVSKNIILALQNSHEIEKTILPQAKAAGNLEEVKQSLVSLNPDFAKRVSAWELLGESYEYKKLPKEQQVRVSAALGEEVDEVSDNAEKSGNIFTLETYTGETIDYDVVSGERTLSRGGYSIESQVPDTGDYQGPKLEYMEVEQATLPKLKKIQKAVEAINAAGLGEDNVDGIKGVLRQSLGISYFTSLGLGDIDSVGEMRRVINKEKNEKQDVFSSAREKYQDTLLALKDSHAGALKQKDKKIKETLSFLEDIGFTMIPQSLTNQIIANININPSTYGFQEKIVFSEGQIGMDKISGESSSLDMLDKQAFAMFVNKMIGITDADGKSPINVAALSNGTAAVGDKEKFQSLIGQSGLLGFGGVDRAMKNLENSQEQTPRLEK